MSNPSTPASSGHLSAPSGVATIREQIRGLQEELFLAGYQETSSGRYVPFFPAPGSFTYLWDLWRSLLPQYAPPLEYLPPEPGCETPATRGEMFRALDGLTRRLEELFGPDPEPRDHVSASPVERAESGSSPVPPIENTGPTSPARRGEPGAGEGPPPPANHRYTLGELIVFLDGLERNREVHRVSQQEQFRRDPVNAALNATYSAALRWEPDENQMPGIRRIELLCDIEPGEAGINAAKVRRLRARICQQQRWRTPRADQLTLDEAADLLEGVRQVPLEDLEQAQQDFLYHGLATLDTIGIGLGEEVQITGLSCKVIAGTTPTACPDANPVLPPSLLPGAERAIRRLYPLPAGTTIHWVGHDSGVRNRCRCHPNAPFAAPFDRDRWAAVAVPPSPGISADRRWSTGPPESTTVAPDATGNKTQDDSAVPVTVGDIRDFLVYQARLAAYREGLRSLDPTQVLAASWFPSAMPMQYVQLALALTPPTTPRLTDDVVWTLATYRRLVETARAAHRERPDESDLMGLVGSVASSTGRTIEELLRMPEREFEQVVASQTANPSLDPMARLADASRCPECHTPPNPLDLAAGGTARCRGCGLWGLATGRCLLPLADDSGGRAALQLHAPHWQRMTPPTSVEVGAGDVRKQQGSKADSESTAKAPTAEKGSTPTPDPVLGEWELAVLEVFRDRHPVLLKNVDVEEATKLSKQTVGEVVTALIDKNLVIRPNGRRKGATVTSEGFALVDRIRKSSADHP